MLISVANKTVFLEYWYSHGYAWYALGNALGQRHLEWVVDNGEEAKRVFSFCAWGASSFPRHRTRRVTTPTFSCSTGRSKDQVCWLACCEKVSGRK